MGIIMLDMAYKALLAFTLAIMPLSAIALPNLALGPFGPGVQDGSEPFNEDGNCANDTAKANAGDDCGEKNNQVRSQDTVFYNWSITATNYTPGQENLKNVIFEQVLHPSANAAIKFERIPARCTPAGDGGTNPSSSITTEANGDIKLLCNLGEFNEGEQISFSTVVKILGDAWNGSTFTSTQQVYSNADDGTANANSGTSPLIGPIEISARPMLDLISSPFRGYYVYGKRDVGNGPENGYYTYYNFRVATHRRMGTESIPQPFSFISELTAKKEAENGADYINSGMEYYMTACQYNPSGWGEETWGKETYYSTRPIEEKVIDSGTCTFARTDPNHKASPYRMTVTGADLSGSRFPKKTIGGSDLSAGPYYYINMRVQFFIPTRVIDNEDGVMDNTGSVFISNILKNFSPNGVSGTSNYGTANEPGFNGAPMADGSISNNIAPSYDYHITPRGSFSTSYYKDDTDTGWNYHYLDGQGWHTGGGLVGPGQAVVEKIFYQNSGSIDLTDPRSCLAFDNSTMKLTDRGDIGATLGKYAYVGEYASNGLDYRDYIVEYGHVDFAGDDPLDKDGDGNPDYNNQTGRYEGQWATQAAVRCDDNVTTWQADPNNVVGGIDAVNMVRTRVIDPATPFEPADYLRLNTPLKPRDKFYGGPHNGKAIPNGTVLASFASVRSDQWASAWYKRYYYPSPETGNSDGDRVTFTRVKPAIDSESLLPAVSPGNTSSTIAGKQIVWKINTAISSILTTPPTVPNTQIIDELPPEVSYNKECTINYAGGTPADLVKYNTGRDGNPKPGYTLLIWNLGTWTANDPIAPRIICTDSDALAPNGTAVVNYSQIKGDGLTGSATELSDTHTITLEQIGSIQVSKKVDITLDDVNDTQIYTLSWANFAASFAIDAPTIIDVFPFNGDDSANSNRTPKSDFKGKLALTGAPTIAWTGGATDGAPLGTWYYSKDDPATINYDPDIDKNSTTNWVTEAALGGDFSQVSAIKFISNYKLEKDGDPHQGMESTYTLQAGDTTNPNSADANKPGDIYTNLFTLDTPSLPAAQFLKSNSVSVSVASYSVGDLVFADVNGNLKYDKGIDIPAPNGTKINLHKAADNSIVATTTLGSAGKPGRYVFTNIGSGKYYITIPSSEFQAGATLEDWNISVTTAGADDDSNEDSDQDGYTVGTVLANGVRTNVFELSAIPPLPGDIPKGNEPLGDNIGQITDTTNDDFSNLTLDIALVPSLDFGDAPASYGKAGHLVPPAPKIYLGALLPDKEAKPQHTANGGEDGLGDDNIAVHDEDSIQLLDPLNITDTRFQVNVSVHNSSASNAKLIAWLDLNNNGTFEANEAAIASVAAGTGGSKQLLWDNIPAGTLQAGKLWMRVRLSTDTELNADNATGSLLDGEVEDYAVPVSSGVNVSGYVFNDRNVSAGTKEANETGIANVTIVLHNTTDNSCISVKTNAQGHYQFNKVAAGHYNLYEAANEAVAIPKICPAVEKDPAGYRSTTANIRSISVTSDHIINQDFGDVLLPRFSPNNADTILPGNVVLYPHKFTAQSNGTVNFTGANTGGKTVGWSNIIYQDNNCNGKLDGIETSTPIAANIATTSGNNICLLNKVYAPNGISTTESYRNTINAAFVYGNTIAGSVNLKVTDITKAAANDEPKKSSRLELRKTVQNISQNTPETTTQNQAKPGEILKYRIYYKNTGSGPITDLEVNDSVPEFTLLKTGSAQCDNTPTGLNCSPVELDPNVEWHFSGTLKGGARGLVSYEVVIE
jgi:uncharacterized repeat protein (TIGR01451 family)